MTQRGKHSYAGMTKFYVNSTQYNSMISISVTLTMWQKIQPITSFICICESHSMLKGILVDTLNDTATKNILQLQIHSTLHLISYLIINIHVNCMSNLIHSFSCNGDFLKSGIFLVIMTLYLTIKL